jgi:outer membrane biosynthesis protein TonB
MRKLLFLFVVASAGLRASAQAAPDPASPLAASAGPDLPAARNTPSRPNPDANGIYHPGDGLVLPHVVHAEDANFSEEARRLRVQGTSVVRVIVDEKGVPKNVRTVQSVADMLTRTQGAPPSSRVEKAARELDLNAIKAVEKYRFQPARFHDAAVPVEMMITVRYTLP